MTCDCPEDFKLPVNDNTHRSDLLNQHTTKLGGIWGDCRGCGDHWCDGIDSGVVKGYCPGCVYKLVPDP